MVLHLREQARQWNLHIDEERPHRLLVDDLVECADQLADRQCLLGELRVRNLRAGVECELVGDRLDGEPAMQDAVHDIGQRVRALLRGHEVGRKRRIHNEAGDASPSCNRGKGGALHIVPLLRHIRIAEPCDERRGRGRLLAFDDAGHPEPVDDAHGVDLASAPAPSPGEGDRAWIIERRQPPGDVRMRDDGGVEGRSLDHGLAAAGVLREQSLPQCSELERVEQLIDGCHVPWLAGAFVEVDADRHIGPQLGQVPVHHHLVQAGTKRLPRLALHLAGAVDESVEGSELLDPLGRCLLANPWNAGKIVAGIPAKRRIVGILRGRQPVALLDRLRGHPSEVGDTLLGIQDGHMLGHELEGVTIAGDNEDVTAGSRGLTAQRGDDVIGLESLEGHSRDPQCREHLLDERHLALELIGR